MNKFESRNANYEYVSLTFLSGPKLLGKVYKFKFGEFYMEVSIQSKTNKDLSYCFSNTSPNGLVSIYPHLADNFSFDPTSPLNEDRYRAVINDCAHPEMVALMEDGIASVTRFIAAFGIKTNPLYVYTIDRTFYQRKANI